MRLGFLALLCAGLVLSTLAPAGYMVAPAASGWLSVQICPETHPLARARVTDRATAMDHAAMGHSAAAHADDGEHGEGAGATQDCTFAGVTKLATGPVDAKLLAATFAFAVLLGVTFEAPLRLWPVRNLRPPLRGPPAFA
ncbi:MAG: DUF2946 family protein [Pseudomonadota bacterium]